MPQCIRSVLAGVLLTIFPILQAGEPTQPRNDTGQEICYGVSGEPAACENQSEPGQDGRFGRDAAAAAGVLPKAGAGVGGFDFTKIANDGSELPANAVLGSAPDQWACTRDNLTGMIWEVKTEVMGPRYKQLAFAWYNPHPGNGGMPGEELDTQLMCNFMLPCNTQAYVDYVNSIELCGLGDWRLPTRDELDTIVHFGSTTNFAADEDYFTRDIAVVWTADTALEPEGGDFAMTVNFLDGHAEAAPKGSGHSTPMLVNGTRFVSEGEPPVCGERQNPEIFPSTAGAFVLEEEGLVRDNRTGLVWVRCSLGQDFNPGGGEGGGGVCDGEAQPMSWEQALQEVAQRNEQKYLGTSDWRMPNVKELASLQERQCGMPTVDVSVFPNSSMETYWSSTTYTFNDQYDHAYVITGEFGHMLPMPKGAEARVRLVRAGGEFDDYSGSATYRVSGSLSGMVGTGLTLRLAQPDGGAETQVVNANGAFAFAYGFSAGDPYEVTVATPPLPFQSCTVANASGVIGSANVANVTVTCAPPDPAIIAIDRSELSFSVATEGNASDSLAISNTGGGILHWSIDTAHAKAMSGGVAGTIDCQSGPDLIVHDDGSAESGYAGNVAWAGGVAIVDKFTPASYPASIRSVCVALAGSAGVTAMDFEIVVFADNGAGGAPGTELGSVAVSASSIPNYPPSAPVWFAYDISSLYTTIEAGSLYVGIRWLPASVNNRIYLMADHSEDRPVGHAGGYYWNRGGAGAWQPTQIGFAEYRSTLVRATVGGAQPLPVGCDDPHAITWMTVTPSSGSTLAGESSAVTVAVNAVGVAPGHYSATLCVASDSNTGNGLVEVPVGLTVTEPAGVLVLESADIEFGDVVVGSQSPARTVTFSNEGLGSIGNVSVAPASAPFSRVGGDCPANAFALAPNQSCTIDYGYAPTSLGAESNWLFVASSGGGAEVVLRGNGIAGAPVAMVRVSGDDQTAPIGERFAVPLSVKVSDSAGHPVSGATVSFATPSGGPSAILSVTEATTDATGVATVTATANEVVGSYQVTATLDAGASVEFALTNLSDEPDDRVFADGFDTDG